MIDSLMDDNGRGFEISRESAEEVWSKGNGRLLRITPVFSDEERSGAN
jgi:hypothetical protein